MKGFTRTLTLTLLLSASGAGLALADDPPVTGSNSGLDQEEDDLLGGDLLGDDTPAPAGVTIPPPEVKRKIDEQIAALAARSEAVGDELFVELANAQVSNAEIERRILDAEQRLKTLQSRTDELTRAMTGAKPEAAPRVQGPRGYGTPLRLGAGASPMADLRNRPYDPVAPLGPSDPQGRQQLKWWETLLLQLAEGVTDIIKVLAEKRTNGLKAEGDAIALGTDERYRPYVDAEVRKAIGTSALGSNLRKTDSRLDDLSLNNGRRTPAPAKRPVATYEGSAKSATEARTLESGPMPQRYLLPLKRNPETGVERPVVSLPLGVPSR